MPGDYFIGVNASEVDRLREQHEAWRPETERLWRDAGFDTCVSILDLGCGPGFTTLDLARHAGPSCEVCALDKAAAYLDYLAAQAVSSGVANVSVLKADLTGRGSIPRQFDGAFCRWFLALLRDDLDQAVRNIRDALRPGGTFAAMEYLTLRTLSCSPPSAAFDAHSRAWIDFYAQHGGDTSVGERLPQRLLDAGFEIRCVRQVGGVADPRHRWWAWWGRLIRDFGPQFVENGLLTGREWEALQQDWAALSEQPDAFLHTPTLLQVVAQRR